MIFLNFNSFSIFSYPIIQILICQCVSMLIFYQSADTLTTPYTQVYFQLLFPLCLVAKNRAAGFKLKWLLLVLLFCFYQLPDKLEVKQILQCVQRILCWRFRCLLIGKFLLCHHHPDIR